MARSRASLVYVGIKSHVLAFDRKSGMEVWRTQLPAKYKSSGSFVNIVRDVDGLFATCAGEVFALDARTGVLIWHDPLKKLGTGLVSIATDLGASSQVQTMAESHARAQAAATTAATTAAI
jgi:outer membrane protein assembly factor BamB